MAAVVACKQRNDDTVSSPTGGDIATMAAAMALNRQRTVDDSKDDAALPADGIATMAVAAARKKEKAMPPVGDSAAMAVALARKKKDA